MNSKKWCRGVLISFFSIMFVIAILVVVVDPYFHYHAPIKGLSYALEDEQYMNDGITRHFEYNALITGTSLTECLSTKKTDELFGSRSVRLTFKGEGFKRINDNLKVAIETNPDLKLVIRGVDTLWFISNEDWMGYDSYPEYLYDDCLWNDVQYVLNLDILVDKVIPELVRTAKGIPAQTFDRGFADKGNVYEVLMEYERPGREDGRVDSEETEEFFRMLAVNLEKNVIETIRDNPDITFYIFFPPYSICWWDEYHQLGDEYLLRRIQMEEYAIRKILSCDNVRLFSFSTNQELVCDLSNYRDDIHYMKDTADQILEWMYAGEYELTMENYRSYIYEMEEFYCNFDYDHFFEEEYRKAGIDK